MTPHIDIEKEINLHLVAFQLNARACTFLFWQYSFLSIIGMCIKYQKSIIKVLNPFLFAVINRKLLMYSDCSALLVRGPRCCMPLECRRIVIEQKK